MDAEGVKMIELPYSLVMEATEDPGYFGFYSTELIGFSGSGHSVENCLNQAKWGMLEHIELMKEKDLPPPPKNPDPKIVVQKLQTRDGVSQCRC